MVRGAAQIPDALFDAIGRLDDPRRPLAETARRVGAEADRLGLTRPSYERLRQLIHQHRELHANLGPSAAELFFLDSWAGITPGLMEELKKPRSERRPRPRT